MTGHPWPHDRASFRYQPSINRRRSSKNILHLLGKREVSPRTKYVPKKLWGEAPKRNVYSSPWTEPIRDARRGILSWAEEESLQHLSGKYCPLVPPPRSTIAAAFSSDGRTLASTHGDHTVKIIDYQKGKCLKVLSGHRRTPWVVRFHPVHPEILASGSLDHEVRLWDAKTAECLGSRDFYRPIASLAFHAKGELLAVACGHKLYIWDYNKNGEGSSPAIILKTRRSLRAVHFHPHAAPFLLTAEVNDLDSSDSSMTQATSQGYFHHPPPAVFVTCGQSSDHVGLAANPSLMSLPCMIVPSFSIDDSRMDLQYISRLVGSSGTQAGHSPSMQFQTDTTMGEQYNSTASPMEAVPPIPSHLYSGSENLVNTSVAFRMETGAAEPSFDAMDTDEIQPIRESEEPNSTNRSSYSSAQRGVPRHVSDRQDAREFRPLLQFLPLGTICWELPFLQGWVMDQQTNFPSMRPHSGTGHENLTQYTASSSILQPLVGNVEAAACSLGISNSISQSGVFGRIGLQNISQSRLVSETGEVPVPSNSLHDGTDAERIISRLQSELATSMAVAAAAELPCTVKLKVWSYDIKNPCALLNVGKCRLTIPHAVLCSEMGAHFSPCGKFLAACVACVLPHSEADPRLQALVHQDGGAGTSPTRHPISAHQVVYELRIYSLEKATFGSVLVSRAIRAAHSLTSIQFSPTSEHILLAYGRRHGSLLKSIVIDGKTTSPIYTVLEVYRVSDMELVRVLPSAEDEVNVACFHPFPGGGLAYGTKEGRLRVLQYDGARDTNHNTSNYFSVENTAGVE
ncbi:hypothetical protein E1A91_D07G176300v1 [Gossypium mustelinum]|uniref:Uncharacterized protein n=1 Tax=Gossypium mustelinum TaxID=34275 RepID=A0A5D2UBR3_GOSMU|nr:hypothetical protein E1A91_D07G176300v1 [Gossypium mustelinum]